MSEYNRYKILKRCFNNYCIIFVNNNSYGIDKELIKIKDKNISYIIVDNLTIVKLYKSINNQYSRYFYYYGIKKILDKIEILF